MAILVGQPFERTGMFPIEDDLLRTKAQMLAVNDDLMPEQYFALCLDDGNFYIYNKRNSVDPETGRYRKLSGDADGDKHFEFSQNTPSARWQIAHNLNKFPSVTIIDSGGSEVVGDIEYPDKNTVVVTFQSAFSGKAYLN